MTPHYVYVIVKIGGLKNLSWLRLPNIMSYIRSYVYAIAYTHVHVSYTDWFHFTSDGRTSLFTAMSTSRDYIAYFPQLLSCLEIIDLKLWTPTL